jgi:hypothetical protein
MSSNEQAPALHMRTFCTAESGSNTPPTLLVGGAIFSTSTRSSRGTNLRRPDMFLDLQALLQPWGKCNSCPLQRPIQMLATCPATP